jgi:dTDP-4-dehydrorhamnose reductase
MKTKVLVIGANGQLGKTIKDLSSQYKSLDFTFADKFDLDITSTKDIRNYLKNNFNYCINCAAYTNVEKAEQELELATKINADAVKKLAQECNVNNTTLIHISTDYVFDGNKTTPYKEEDKTNPINHYGKSKLLGEKYIKEELENYFIIRTSWLYSKYGINFFKKTVNKLKKNKELTIITSQKGTPTSCIDLGVFILYLISNEIKSFGVYHFSALGETTWYDFAVEITKQLNYNTDKIKPIENFKSKAQRPLYSVLDNSKSKIIFNKTPFWKDSVKQTVTNL